MSNLGAQPTRAGLRAFVAVAEHRHFRAAAESLGISQPSLSQALASLEAAVGLRLVERATRRVMLTSDGRQLLAPAVAALDAYDAFCAAAAGRGDPLTDHLTVGIIPTVAPYVLPVLLPGLAERYPRLEITLVEDQTARLLTALSEGRLDLAVLALPADAPGLTQVPMYDEDFVLALPPGHRLAETTGVEMTALASLPLLLLAEGHCLRDQALDACQQAGVRPEHDATRAASLQTVVHCVASGLGVTLLPASAIAAETASGALATASFTSPAPGRSIGLVYRSGSGRDHAYRELAATMAALVATQHPVRAATGLLAGLRAPGSDRAAVERSGTASRAGTAGRAPLSR
ncbi:MAG: LysR substrate-binding domain-containing protein [Micrococcales bacterium]|nr:LysR substrate-binding domain-containing protein [Micrococcales bacterium]